MNAEEVLKLAKLARIGISADEAENLSHEFEAILGYVGQVKTITNEELRITNEHSLRNIMRDDANPHESGKFSEAILKNAPVKENGYIKVKKIM